MPGCGRRSLQQSLVEERLSIMESKYDVACFQIVRILSFLDLAERVRSGIVLGCEELLHTDPLVKSEVTWRCPR